MKKELVNRLGSLEAISSRGLVARTARTDAQMPTERQASLREWFPRGRFNFGADDHSDMARIGTLLESWEAWEVYFEFVRPQGLEPPLPVRRRNMLLSIVTDSKRIVYSGSYHVYTHSTVSPSAEVRQTIHSCRFRVKESNLISINLRGSVETFSAVWGLCLKLRCENRIEKGGLVLLFSSFLLSLIFFFLTCFTLWRSLPSSAPAPIVFASVSLSLGASIITGSRATPDSL